MGEKRAQCGLAYRRLEQWPSPEPERSTTLPDLRQLLRAYVPRCLVRQALARGGDGGHGGRRGSAVMPDRAAPPAIPRIPTLFPRFIPMTMSLRTNPRAMLAGALAV